MVDLQIAAMPLMKEPGEAYERIFELLEEALNG